MLVIKRLLLICMVVWLPCAGAIAAVMPISGILVNSTTSAVSTTEAAASSEAVSDDDNFIMPCHGKSGSRKMSLGQSCSHCVLCHLAGALSLGTMPVMPSVPPVHFYVSTLILAHPSFIPELLIRPPRTSLA